MEMNGGFKWKNLKERLGFNGMGCCGPIWSRHPSTVDLHHELEQITDRTAESVTSLLVGSTGPPISLAMALEAERNQVGLTTEEQVNEKTLMTLIEETDGVDWKIGRKKKMDGRDGVGCDWVCCVCIDRRKGAAFIPCGHAFCRVCSRELWTSRGSCPICNRLILQILNIF